jgi:hypothetical protein
MDADYILRRNQTLRAKISLMFLIQTLPNSSKEDKIKIAKLSAALEVLNDIVRIRI